MSLRAMFPPSQLCQIHRDKETPRRWDPFAMNFFLKFTSYIRSKNDFLALMRVLNTRGPRNFGFLIDFMIAIYIHLLFKAFYTVPKMDFSPFIL